MIENLPTFTTETAETLTLPPEPLVVAPPADTRLGQLHASWEQAKADADEAAERLKVITDGIKSELAEAAGDETRMELLGDNGPPLVLAYVESWRFDSKKLKTEDPATWVRYATKGGSWRLERKRAGKS